MSLPRRSKDQSKKGKSISKSKAKAGDLIFFKKAGRVHHVGLVVSNLDEDLQMIHASSSAGIQKIIIKDSRYWSRKSHFIRRIKIEH